MKLNRPMKSHTVRQLLSRPKPKEKSTLLWKKIVGDDLIQIRSKTINIVACRSPRKSARLAMQAALDLSCYESPRARWHLLQGWGAFVEAPGSDQRFVPEPTSGATGVTQGGPILYVNTYASPELMQQLLEKETDLKMQDPPETDPTTGEETSLEFSNLDGVPLAFLDMRIGVWVAQFELVKELVRRNSFKTVVVNSFEFACLTSGEKRKLANHLRQLAEELGVTVVVFTNYMRADLVAGEVCPGAIGLLAAYSDCVSRINEEPASTLPSKKRQKESGLADVHEKIAALRLQYDDPVRGILKGEKVPADEYFDETIHWSGSYLSKLTLTPLLKKYYEDHPDHIFEPGYRPTEEGLMRGEAFREEWKKYGGLGSAEC